MPHARAEFVAVLTLQCDAITLLPFDERAALRIRVAPQLDVGNDARGARGRRSRQRVLDELPIKRGCGIVAKRVSKPRLHPARLRVLREDLQERSAPRYHRTITAREHSRID